MQAVSDVPIEVQFHPRLIGFDRLNGFLMQRARNQTMRVYASHDMPFASHATAQLALLECKGGRAECTSTSWQVARGVFILSRRFGDRDQPIPKRIADRGAAGR